MLLMHPAMFHISISTFASLLSDLELTEPIVLFTLVALQCPRTAVRSCCQLPGTLQCHHVLRSFYINVFVTYLTTNAIGASVKVHTAA